MPENYLQREESFGFYPLALVPVQNIADLID
jgi:hypothetical protein